MRNAQLSCYTMRAPLSVEYVMSELEWMLTRPLSLEALEDLDALVRETRRRVPPADRALGCTFMVWPAPPDTAIILVKPGKKAPCGTACSS